MLATKGDLPIRARNSRYIFSGKELNSSSSSSDWPANTNLQGLDETVLVLERSPGASTTRLTLSCPAYDQGRTINYKNRVLDIKSQGSPWTVGPRNFAKPYK